MNLRHLDHFRLQWDPVLRSTFQGADCVLGIAEYVREHLTGLRLRRFEVMSETGLDTVPEPINRAERSGPVKLLFVGRLIRTKGVRDIIRAMHLVRDLLVELDIVGEGPEREECERLISNLGLAGRICLHGWRTKAEVAQFYRQADVFVFPSYREPGGNVALEAMGFSLPLVVVDRGGPGSAVSSHCAIKLDATTPEALAVDIAEAIRRLATDAALRQKMGVAAYEHVRQTALWSAKLDRMDSIYADLMRRAHRSSPVALAQGIPG
jgi:glycosyltransferase involved in cell wall biosynthesis